MYPTFPRQWWGPLWCVNRRRPKGFFPRLYSLAPMSSLFNSKMMSLERCWGAPTRFSTYETTYIPFVLQLILQFITLFQSIYVCCCCDWCCWSVQSNEKASSYIILFFQSHSRCCRICDDSTAATAAYAICISFTFVEFASAPSMDEYPFYQGFLHFLLPIHHQIFCSSSD